MKNQFSALTHLSLTRHFVAISCMALVPKETAPKPLMFSSFLIAVEGSFFLVTAGHVIKDIQRYAANGVVFDTWRLTEQTYESEFRSLGIPFEFTSLNWITVEDEESGLDYAAAEIFGLLRSNLEAGKPLPITLDLCADHDRQYEFLGVMGILASSVSQIRGTAIDGKLVIVPLALCDAPIGAEKKKENQFYSRAYSTSGELLPDPAGLSGGIVFGLRKVDSQWHYSILGIQSGFFESSEKYSACPLAWFVYSLQETMRELRAEVSVNLNAGHEK